MEGNETKHNPHISFIRDGEKWACRFIQEHLSRYEFAASFASGKVVLDLGCGNGYGAKRIVDAGAKLVIGADISLEAMRMANEKYGSITGLDFVKLDGEKLCFEENMFDLIVAFEVIEHVPAYESLLSEIVRCLKPDGLLICSTPNKEIASPGVETPSCAAHFKEFYIWELKNMLDAQFNSVLLYGQEMLWRKQDSMKANVATLVKPVFIRLPQLYYITNLITRFVFREYRMVKLEEVYQLDNKYYPLLLDSVETSTNCTPLHIIALASGIKSTASV